MHNVFCCRRNAIYLHAAREWIYNTVYNKVISLRNNCEVSYRIRDYLGHLDSYPYTWSLCQSHEGFLKSIGNISDLLSGDTRILPSGLVEDPRYQLGFRVKVYKNQLVNENGVIIDEQFMHFRLSYPRKALGTLRCRGKAARRTRSFDYCMTTKS